MRTPLASEILETIPAVMQAIRREMRRKADQAQPGYPSLTVGEFRTLLYVDRHGGTDLSAIAEYVGLSLPTASRTVETLIGNGLLVRMPAPRDRRRLALTLSVPGRREMERTRGAARRGLGERVGRLDAAAQTELTRALRRLRKIFHDGASSLPERALPKPRRVTTPIAAKLRAHPHS
jgi:DNA-binding MarR family transcriptional regulator